MSSQVVEWKQEGGMDGGVSIDLESPKVQSYLNEILEEVEQLREDKTDHPLARVPIAMAQLVGEEKANQMGDIYILGMLEYSVEISIADGIKPVIEYSGSN